MRPSRPIRSVAIAALLALGAGIGACGGHAPPIASAPGGSPGYDAIIIPGCPSDDEGGLTLCQKARALWAVRFWEAGATRYFITSGAAVYSPYVEAEAIAQAMTAAGIPADRIYLEPEAFHTDENMHFSLRIARRLGLARVAVASDAAFMDCKMIEDLGSACDGYAIDRGWVRARHRQLGDTLERLRAPKVADFRPLKEREREIAARTGRTRPPSFVLYLGLAMKRMNHERWSPAHQPTQTRPITWAERAAELGLTNAATAVTVGQGG